MAIPECASRSLDAVGNEVEKLSGSAGSSAVRRHPSAEITIYRRVFQALPAISQSPRAPQRKRSKLS